MDNLTLLTQAVLGCHTEACERELERFERDKAIGNTSIGHHAHQLIPIFRELDRLFTDALTAALRIDGNWNSPRQPEEVAIK